MEWASHDEIAGTDQLFINLPQSGLSTNKIKEPTSFFLSLFSCEKKNKGSFFPQMNQYWLLHSNTRVSDKHLVLFTPILLKNSDAEEMNTTACWNRFRV